MHGKENNICLEHNVDWDADFFPDNFFNVKSFIYFTTKLSSGKKKSLKEIHLFAYYIFKQYFWNFHNYKSIIALGLYF